MRDVNEERVVRERLGRKGGPPVALQASHKKHHEGARLVRQT